MSLAYTPSFIVPPHLAEFDIPLLEFAASRPEFTHFVVGGLVFSQSPFEGDNSDGSKDSRPRALLIQRAASESFAGLWEGAGGSCELTDATLLVGVARELEEETGLHVSKFIDLVAVDQWVKVKQDGVHRVAKFTFLVEVHEANPLGSADGNGEVGVAPSRWEDGVKLDPIEHQAFVWATEEEVRQVVESGTGKYNFLNEPGKNLLTAFRLLEKCSSSSG